MIAKSLEHAIEIMDDMDCYGDYGLFCDGEGDTKWELMVMPKNYFMPVRIGEMPGVWSAEGATALEAFNRFLGDPDGCKDY